MQYASPPRRRLHQALSTGALIGVMGFNLFATGGATFAAQPVVVETKALPASASTQALGPMPAWAPPTPGYLTGPARGDALEIALNYLRANKATYGFTEADIAEFVVARRYTSAHNGLTHLYLVQRWQGIEVFNGTFNFNIDAQGRILFVGNRWVSHLANTVNTAKPTLSAQTAVEKAAAHMGLTLSAPLTVLEQAQRPDQATLFSTGGIAQAPIAVELIYDASGKQPRLAWNVIIGALSGEDWRNVRVDAVTGAILSENNWVVSENWGDHAGHEVATTTSAQTTAGTTTPVIGAQSTALGGDGSSYKVYPWPVESPIHTAPLPPADGRITVTQPSDPMASPFGWHDTNGAVGPEFTITQGNNAQAYTDLNDDDTPDAGSSPDGGAGLDFIFPLDLTQGPDAYRPAAVTNLFYWNNLMHDIQYLYGFDEASGNFQVNNYGRGGTGNDSVQAEAQDGGGTNNANFFTPSDGQRPRMQMYIWTAPTPDRDGDLDSGIIAHEYGHGISNRLTGDSVNCLNNSEQMGEGWSDWFSIFMTMKAGEDYVAGRGIGTYALNQPITGVGIRPARYSVSMTVNNYTYANLGSLAIPHGVGFMWNTMLYEMNAALVARYGFNPDLYGAWNTGGNNLANQLIMDGMKIQPCSPGFVDGRNAILAADQALTGGANRCIIWKAFAKRGLGFSALQGSVNSTSDGTAAFDIPNSCNFLTPPPAQNICQGQNAMYTVQVGAAFTTPVTMSATGNPAPTTATFNPNPVVTVPNTTVLTIGNTGSAPAGNYTVTITATDAATSTSVSTQLGIVAGVPGTATPVAPADGATNVNPNVPLSWTPATGAASYYLEIATDPGFTTVVYTATVTGTSHTTSPLAPNTTFYWRVRGLNACGNSSFSPAFSFTTMNLAYQTVCASPNTVIADNTTVTTTLNVPSGAALIDLDVILTATHTWVGDVTFTVTKGAAQSMIVDRPGTTGSGFGCANDNVGARLNDEGTDGPVENQCSATPPALFGQPTPNNPLSVFDGQPFAGLWSLAVRDSVGSDTGVVQSWCLVGTVSVPSGPAITLEKTVGTNPAVCATSDTVTVGYGSNVTYCYKATNSGTVSLTTHSLVDSHLGTLINNQNIVLAPLASTLFTVTTPITTNTVNSATWSSSFMTYTASASDWATVTVAVTPTIMLSTYAMSYTQGPNTSVSHPLVISNTGLGSTLNWVITETTTAPTPGTSSGPAAPGATATDRANAPQTDVQPSAPIIPVQPVLLPPVPTLNEGFDNVAVITTTGGWFAQNNSSPLGGTNWFQGNSTVFPAQGGAATAYLGANFNNTSGTGTISNWMLTPELNLNNGATFTFYTRKVTPNPTDFPDRLQVRMSTSGASTNVGTAATDVGDFTTLLLDINSGLVVGGYPTVWTQFTVTVSGLSGPTTGRLAFRYFVTNGGPNGANSDYIGIDTVTYAAPLSGCNVPSNVPWLSVSPSSGSTLGGNSSTVNVTFNTTGLTVGNTYTGTVCVNSNASNQPQISVPVTLTVGGNFSVTVTPTTSALSGLVGTTISYSVWITNTGDSTDTFDIGVSNTPAFTTTVSSPVGPLAPGQSAQVWVMVQIPSTALGGSTSTANLFVSSQSGNASANFSLTTTALRRVFLPYVTKAP